ncbi:MULTISPECIES: HNH endonuclease [unclassified Coleofasciculus]|uniref:HNH endonuclease n=1 Tax=unclassified Coleofasciculus TaxID=2692782 RepID=UPI0018828E09|nr:MULTISPECIES: HNH endonuclease signature motif containing protein [unclassified Coleofasciculus]MBE9129414.1 HNH endonuclease [Coleofasciculus sp. LEGE 07081]MBE9152031.1 HNH endonuclease [Coleofasciculus sp. LEGE 07092]
MNLHDKKLEDLFKLADKVGNRRYHKLTSQDFEDYREFDHWRYVNGDVECGTTQESKDWVRDNSDWHCPVCGSRFADVGGRTIDHKLPRAQYPWLSLDFRNLWVICRSCNRKKGEMHWYKYEHYIFIHYPDLYQGIQLFRPKQLLKSLKVDK